MNSNHDGFVQLINLVAFRVKITAIRKYNLLLSQERQMGRL